MRIEGSDMLYEKLGIPDYFIWENMIFGVLDGIMYQYLKDDIIIKTTIPFQYCCYKKNRFNIIVMEDIVYFFNEKPAGVYKYDMRRNIGKEIVFLDVNGLELYENRRYTIRTCNKKIYLFPMTSDEIIIFNTDKESFQIVVKWKSDILKKLKRERCCFERVHFQDICIFHDNIYMNVQTDKRNIVVIYNLNEMQLIGIHNTITEGSNYGLAVEENIVWFQNITSKSMLVRWNFETQKKEAVLELPFENDNRCFIMKNQNVVGILQSNGRIIKTDPMFCNKYEIFNKGGVLRNIIFYNGINVCFLQSDRNVYFGKLSENEFRKIKIPSMFLLYSKWLTTH